MPKKYIALCLTIVIAVIYYYFFSMDIYSKNNVDISAMKKLKISTLINSVSNITGAEIYTKNGYNYLSKTFRKDGIKDMVTVTKNGYGVDLYLFNTVDQASKFYIEQKKLTPEKIQKSEDFSDFDRYYMTYIKQTRNPDAHNLPSGSSSSKIVFQKQNLVVQFNGNYRVAKNGEEEKLIKFVATELNRLKY